MSFSDEQKRRIWDRDDRHCQECGLPVAQPRGGIPQTHHIVPRSQGGEDMAKNAITLCLLCHASKLAHTFMLPQTKVEDYPQYIKPLMWDLGLNMIAFAERLDPRNFPSGHSLLAWIDGAMRTLQSIRGLADDCAKAGVGSGELVLPKDFAAEQEQLESIIQGVRIGWSAHHTQRALDRSISDPHE